MVPELSLEDKTEVLVHNLFTSNNPSLDTALGIKESKLIKGDTYRFIECNYDVWERGVHRRIIKYYAESPLKLVSRAIIEDTAETRMDINYKLRWISGGKLYDNIEKEFPEKFENSEDRERTRIAVIIYLLSRGFIHEYLRRKSVIKK